MEKLMPQFPFALMVLCLVPLLVASAQEAVFVEAGKPRDIVVHGKSWEPGEGYLECSGKHNYLFAGKGIGRGDAHVRVRMALLKGARSAASVTIDGKNHFGFDGAGAQGMFVSGSLFGKLRFIGPLKDYVQEGKPFDFEIVRKSRDLTYHIDGKQVFKWRDRRKKFGAIALRPWRATMRVYEFSATGNMEEPVMPREVTLGEEKPFDSQAIDLSQDESRRVVIAQGETDAYKGHPTTLLLPDNKTMFCVYPLGHGRPDAVLRRSDDAGLTWGPRVETPANWRESTNCPALFRLIGPDGVARVFVYEGVKAMRQAVSLDEGRTWSPMEPNGLKTTMPFTTIIRLRDGRHMGGWNFEKSTYISFSDDGGLTWSPQECIATETDEFYGAWPCEPAFIRSPDGDQIACVMRENSRRYFGMVTFTNDEGKTWSAMKETARELTGDRHQPRYSTDGRLVIPYRDTAPASPTKNHFVAWIGTYDDIVHSGPGQYRVKLLHSYAGGDCGYPGLELLPDGTFVATTYCKYRPGPEKQSVVSVRFKLSEIDEIARRAQ